MRLDRLDLNLLVALDILLEECSVSAAARRLNLSQSATSGALLRLREYFEDELLASVGARMVLTVRAEELRDPVREVLAFIRHRIAKSETFDPATAQRTFKIVTSDYILDVALRPFMQRIQEIAPGIGLEIMLPTIEMAEQLNRREFDMIISVRGLLDDRHPKLSLFTDDHVVVAWNGNSRIADGVDQALFHALPQIAVHFGSARAAAHVERFYDDNRIARNVVMSVPFFSAVPPLLVGTDRIATMMRRQATHYASLLPLSLHECPFPIPDLDEVVQFHQSQSGDPGTLWFTRELMASVGAGRQPAG